MPRRKYMAPNKFFQSTLIAIITSLSITTGIVSLKSQAETVPDFSSYTDVKEKKKAFFEFMYPKIFQANKAVLETRKNLEAIALKLQEGKQISSSESKKIKSICDKYRADCNGNINQSIKNLLSRVDIIPPSLTLAQAANESSWGTSRFAKEANNYFGQWCYKKGCGVVPKRRNAGSNHEVQRFKDPADSVAGYVYNINTGSAYATVRKFRAVSRTKGKVPSSLDMVKGLIKYSERGEEYINEITSMITYNKLQSYDERFWSEIK